MAIVKLGKGTRDHILKSEREGYFEKEIAKVEDKLQELPDDADHIEQREDLTEQIKSLQKQSKSVIKKLNQYGQTTWKLHSIDLELLEMEMAKIKIVMSTQKGITDKEVTSGFLNYATLRSRKAVKLGLDGWENLRDEKGKEIPFDKMLIGQLPPDIVMELANEITGVLDEDELGN